MSEPVHASEDRSGNNSGERPGDSERYNPSVCDKRCKYCNHFKDDVMDLDDRGGCHMYYQFLKQRGEATKGDPLRVFITVDGKTYILVHGEGIKPGRCPYFQATVFPDVITVNTGTGRGVE